MISSMIYYGHTYFENSLITKYAQFLVDAIGVYTMVMCVFLQKTLDKYTRRLVCSLSLFILLTTIYVVVTPSVYVSNTDYDFHGWFPATALYKVEMACLLSFFPAVYFSKRNLLQDTQMKVLFIVTWLFATLSYFSYMSYLQDLNEAMFVINNMSYIVLSASALIFFAKKPVALVYIGVTFILILLSAKRSALIGFATMAAIYIWHILKESKVSHSMYKNIVLILLLSAVLYMLLADNSDATNFMLSRLEKDGTNLSNRDNIWKAIMTRYADGNIFNILFGLGYNVSVETVGNFAHNDWIEILSSMGPFGVYIYALIYLIPIARIRNSKQNTAYRMTIVICLAQLFIHSLSSRAIFFSEYAVFFIAIGYSMQKMSKS